MNAAVNSSVPLRIALVNLTGGGLSGGYRKYLRRLVPLLQKDPALEKLTVFVPEPVSGSFPIGDGTYEILPYRGKSASPAARAHLALNFDVVFLPTARWIDCGATAVVSMVRNMEALTRPFAQNLLKEGVKNILRYLAARQAVKRSQRVIGVSRFVLEFLERRWNAPPERLGLVYHGSDPVAAEPAGEIFGGPEPRLFTAGSIIPYRGLEDLIQALPFLNKAGFKPHLSIAGGVGAAGKLYHVKCRNMAVNLGVDPQISWLGELGEAQLREQYRQCDLFVMTSRIEACPNVALEAMASGCFCISSDSQPMPEFFGDAALYYKTGQPESLADQLLRGLKFPGAEVVRFKRSAQTIAARFSWEECARQTIAELQRAYTGLRPAVRA